MTERAHYTVEPGPADSRVGSRSSGARRLSVARIAAIAAGLIVFVRSFDHTQPQWLVDGLWVLALILWVSEVRSWRSGTFLGLTVRRAEVWPIALILVVFACAWLPFYKNWRWAFTGDSISLFGSGYYLYTNGLTRNLLSVHGIDNHFTVLWEVTYNLPVFLFGPNMFGHRFGLFLMASLALVAIYTFYTLVVGRGWSAAIVVATAMNYVWLWFSYVSYLKTDSFVFYYVTLTLAALIWRHPERLGLWMLCGLTVGLSTLFTPAAWAGIGIVSMVFGLFALGTRRFAASLVFVVSFLLAAVPILQEVPWLLEMTRTQAGTDKMPEWSYLLRMFQIVVLSPYESYTQRLGVQGPFLPMPLGVFSLVGLAVGAVAIVPPLRRWLRIPRVAPLLLGLLLWDAMLLALTNKGYGIPSHKRTYNLIPLQVFFALLPVMCVHAWAAGRQWLQRATVGALVVALLTYGYGNWWFMAYPGRGVYGTNVFDGLIELRQRYADRSVVLVTSREGLLPSLAKDGMFQVAYQIADNLTISMEFAEATIESACGRRALVCYEPFPDRQRMQPLFEHFGTRLKEIELLNTVELHCFDCR